MSRDADYAKVAVENVLVQLQVSEHLFNILKTGTFETHNGPLIIENTCLVRQFRGMHDGPPETALTINGRKFKLAIIPIEQDY